MKQDATKELHVWGEEDLSPLQQKISDRISEDVDDTTANPLDFYQTPSKQCIEDIIQIVLHDKQRLLA